MLEKKKNKVHRKQAKALKIANKDYDIEEVDLGRSSCLLVCNAGLMTGASRYSIYFFTCREGGSFHVEYS